MRQDQIEDLQAVFVHARTAWAISPADVSDAIDRINSRYARELLSLLATKDLGTWDGVEFICHPYNNPTEALAGFRQQLGLDTKANDVIELTPSGETSPRKTRQEDEMTTTAASDNHCACNCGRSISKRSTFAQGHDAKMVSNAVDSLVHGAFGSDYLGLLDGLTVDADIQDRMDAMGRSISKRFSEALSVKFHNAAYSAWDKSVKGTKAEGGESTWTDAGTVKVGRWEYPAQSNGRTLRRNTKRDGSGEWVQVA